MEDIMGFLTWIIIGGLAGWIANMIVRTERPLGLVGNIVIGIVGAIIGGWALKGGNSYLAFNLPSLLTATVGACITLLIVKVVKRI